MNKKKLSIAASLLWAAIVFVLHVMRVRIPREDSVINIPHADKVVHFILFAILSFLIMRTVQLYRAYKPALTEWLLVFLVCSFYGALMEYLQAILPSQRDGDVYDWIADLFGSVAGIWLAAKNFFPSIFGTQPGK